MIRRFGKFVISRKLLIAEPELMQMILATTIVVECRCDYAMGCFEYTAMSEHFDEVPNGHEIEFYGIEFSVEGLTTGFSWKQGGGVIGPPE
jgi:hypothetical protein